MTAATHECALRCATVLRDRFPTRKHLARAIERHPDTAGKYLREDCPELPDADVMVRLAALLGDQFVRWVYAPATGWTGADDMETEIEGLRRRADELAQRLNAMRETASAGQGAGVPATRNVNGSSSHPFDASLSTGPAGSLEPAGPFSRRQS